MALKVLGIAAGPRRRGNSARLLAAALEGAAGAGAETETLALAGRDISPCVACNACFKTGECRIGEDDFPGILARLLAADRVIFATPVFFMTVCAQGKLLIDRCQCLWSRRYVLERPLYPDGPRDRRALVIAVGGSRSKKMFEAVGLTMKYWLDALELAPAANLFVSEVDEAGAVERVPAALEAARRLGRELADPDRPAPAGPETVLVSGGQAGDHRERV